jgi:hypothetical protein
MFYYILVFLIGVLVGVYLTNVVIDNF